MLRSLRELSSAAAHQTSIVQHGCIAIWENFAEELTKKGCASHAQNIVKIMKISSAVVTAQPIATPVGQRQKGNQYELPDSVK